MKRHLGRGFLAALTLMLLGSEAWPQTAQTSPPPAQLAPSQTEPAARQPEPPKSNPGLVEEIGRILKDSATGLSSTLQGPRDAINDLNARTRDAAVDGLSHLAPQMVVTGRSVCPVAGNGAPDCKAASDRLCKDKGYKDGKSLDIETAEKCSAKVYLSGRTGAPGECRTENFVTRAICQ